MRYAEDGGPLEPLSKAPSLFSVNGIGLRVHGRRNVAEDGSYVTTRYFTLLFLPILPIDAFRVADAERGALYFLGKVPLTENALLWRRLVVGSVLAAALGMAFLSYWTSPERRLSVALDEVRAAEREATSVEARSAVVAGYESVIHEFAPEVPPAKLGGAAASVVRLLAAEIGPDFALADLDRALRIVRRVEALPGKVVAAEAGPSLARNLAAWAGALAGDEASVRGAIRLLDEAYRLASDPGTKQKRNELQRRLADVLADEWPLEAVHVYAGLKDPEAIAAAGTLLAGLGEDPAVWIQLAADVETWAKKAGEEQADLAAELRRRVDVARERAADASRAELLENGEEGRLRRALAAAPRDQELAASLAQTLRGSGRIEAALEVMEGLGGPGELARGVQLVLATLWSDLGRLEEARALLERILQSRLPDYEALRRSYVRRFNERQDELVRRAQRGNLPLDLQNRLAGKSDEEQQRLFGEWLLQELENDASLQELRTAYDRFLDVVPTALGLGSVTLRLASEADGDERSRLLEAAERVFLAIQGDAEGVPSYHLGLGQVYLRLGKSEQGEQELSSVLAIGDDDLSLQVAEVYRDLGMLVRARQVNTEVAERATDFSRQQALINLALLADTLDDRERWYRQADPQIPFVRNSLLDIEADRLASKGAYAEADKKYAQIFEWQVKTAGGDSSSANNAALTSAQRYGCTGDMRHLDRAVELMEGAIRLSPDSALVTGNASEVIRQRGYLRVLERWLDLRSLRLSGPDAESVIEAMLEGPERATLLDALRRSGDLRRSRELVRHQEVLGPHRPDGYVQELGWYGWLEDLDELRNLKARVERVEGIDRSSTEHQIEIWLGGEKDEESRGNWEGQLAAIRARRAELPAGSSPATRAASWLLEARAESYLALLDGALPHARAAVETLKQARAAWPGIGADRDLASDEVALAVLETAQAEPALAEAWKKDGRRLGTALMVSGLMDPPSDAVDALRRRPELAEAVGLLRQARRPALLDHVLARLTRDEDLAASGRQVFDSELTRLEAELRVLLVGGESSRIYLALLERGP